MRKNKYPEGWDEKRVKKVLAYYDKRYKNHVFLGEKKTPRGHAQTLIEVPRALVPIIRELIARHDLLQLKRNSKGK